MRPAQFTAKRVQYGSQRVVAKELGIGFRTLQRIEAGSYGDPIPLKYERLVLSLQSSTHIPDGEK